MIGNEPPVYFPILIFVFFGMLGAMGFFPEYAWYFVLGYIALMLGYA